MKSIEAKLAHNEAFNDAVFYQQRQLCVEHCIKNKSIDVDTAATVAGLLAMMVRTEMMMGSVPYEETQTKRTKIKHTARRLFGKDGMEKLMGIFSNAVSLN